MINLQLNKGDSLVPDKTEVRNISYSCKTCNKDVVFQVALIISSNDEREYFERFDKIIGCSGQQQCQVILDKLPFVPLYTDWPECPFYGEYKGYRRDL
jgi:hypothetical protein